MTRLVVFVKAKPHGEKSLKPPKAWWRKTLAQVKRDNPDYSEEQARKTVGSIWYHSMSKKQRSGKRKAEGKKYGKAPVAKAKSDPVTAGIVAFLKQHPKPEDKDVHELAEILGVEPDELEEKVYALLGSFLAAGKAKETGTTEGIVDPEQLKMGIKVEAEHTTSKALAKRIALDHLSEDRLYYTKLKKMEAQKSFAKSKRVWVPPSAGRKGYYRQDPRTSKGEYAFDITTGEGQKRLMEMARTGIDPGPTKYQDLKKKGDYGADPIGDGTFRMVPSGDIVSFEERMRRLGESLNLLKAPYSATGINLLRKMV